jgi:hypothetical protein
MTHSSVVTYFGLKTVESAIEDYFYRHGLSEHVRDELMVMSVHKEDDFFEMVCNFVENTN